MDDESKSRLIKTLVETAANSRSVECAAVAGIAIVLLAAYDEGPEYGDGGQAYTRFLLNDASPELFKQITRMERETFDTLVDQLDTLELLEDGRSVSIDEQVLIFLDIVCHNGTMRQTSVKFRRGVYTIKRYFNAVLDALFELYPRYIKMTTRTCRLPKDISEKPENEPFKDCIGALDGVYLPVTAPDKTPNPWRNRHGMICQYVLAAVNLNFEFIYVLAGWEGCALDSQVLNSATQSKRLDIPDGKYLLSGPRYPLQKGLMTPFRGARYDPQEQTSEDKKFENKEELFNSRHATLRHNIVEEIFGCMKQKFPVLQTAPEEVELRKQVRLVYALCMLWNFIRKHEPIENLFDDTNRASEPSNRSNYLTRSLYLSKEDDEMKKQQQRIATDLWDQFTSKPSQS
ncbi:hypothetical protein PGT21_050244 [Puccinia graminis f. sp. tritici]|uniref:Uncharacterized protein n=1 Tax=Puccinia graminis f. sp. tritici TaxID=56615 RepID=A0A5B0MF47_PUCGR|nr:hypothetical protein PGTUg99_050001 [Puccinia graminis f. sp. tritici]KAA1091157.1 hypothetical protein PGT21_050244 [Puccinia graminis f. sp. tritici]